MLQRLLYRRPCIAQKSLVPLSGEHIIAVNHQDKFAVQIFPVIGVLPAELVWLHKWIFLRHTQIVRNRPFRLAHTELQRLGMLCLPIPEIFVGQVLRHCIGELAKFLFVNLRPEFG